MKDDVRFALRSLRKDKAFTLATFLTLALCIGANTALFGFVYTVLLEPLPVPQPERLVRVINSYPKAGLNRAGAGVPDYLDRVAGMKTLQSLALYRSRAAASGESGQPERVVVMMVTPSYFRVAHVRPARGRVFSEEDGEPGRDDKAVISYAYWQERYAGSPDVIGKEIRVDDRPHTIVGVMPRGFQLVEPADARIWLPLTFSAAHKSDGNRHNNSWGSVGRLRDGASLAQARDEVNRVNAATAARLPAERPYVERTGYCTEVLSLQDDLVSRVRAKLYLLWGATLLVLLIGCTNVVNLALARSHGRLRDLTIRLALGASRRAIVRHLLAENLLLTVTSGLAGLLVGWGSLRVAGSFDLRQIPRATGIGLEPANVAFTLGLALLVGVLVSLFPIASACGVNLSLVLHQGGRTGTSGRASRRLRQALVATQVALAFVLLVGAGLLASSFQRVLAVHPGFDTSRILTANVTLPRQRYLPASKQPGDLDPRPVFRFADATLEGLRNSAGVVNAGITSAIPLGGRRSENGVVAEGQAARPDAMQIMATRVQATAGYLETLRVPLRSGRFFNTHDTADSPAVVIVDVRLAQRLWPGQDPIGRRMSEGTAESPGVWCTVVGLVGETKQNGLVSDAAPSGVYYLPIPQAPALAVSIAVRTSGDPASLAPTLRRVIASLDPGLPVFDVKTMEDVEDDSLLTRRWPMLVTTAFSAVALVLTAVGLYGVLVYLVSQRSKEIGIRMALGGTPGAILRLMGGEAARLMGAGLAGGAVAFMGLRRLLESQLYGVQSGDPGVLAIATLVLGLVAAAACAMPASRAARLDPAKVLDRG